jgi:signal transduction histidine kinase
MTDTTHHKLRERVKELTALHATARLLQDDLRPSAEVVRDIVALLPPAWQYPAITEARIRFQDLKVATPGFRETPWMQRAAFGDGTIEIAYTDERPAEAEGPFLIEERDLLESLAEMLRSFFRRRLADQAVQSAYNQLEQLVAQRTAELQQEVEQHRQARLQIEEYQQRLRRLATELSLADARERREIAVDLHDQILQEFAFIKMRIQQFRGDAVFCGFERNLEDILALMESAIRHTRQLTFTISTPILYELGLAAALEWLCESYGKRHKLSVKAVINHPADQLSEAVRVTLFKCVQELLTNVVKYARAASVTVSLSATASQIQIAVADDGCGFDPAGRDSAGPADSGFGLFSIRERLKSFGGEMRLESAPGRGTTVSLVVPREGL